MNDRLFVPLKSIWFDLFKKGEKKWELRGVSNRFNTKTVYKGRHVELRKGYNGESLFGKISDFMIIDNFTDIDYKIWREAIPQSCWRDDLLMQSIHEYRDKYSKFILFKVDIEDIHVQRVGGIRVRHEEIR